MFEVIGAHARAVELPHEAGEELMTLAGGRRLLIDWFKGRLCGSGHGIGDVSIHWLRADEPLPDDEWVRLDGFDPIEAYAQREIVALLARAGARLEIHGVGPFRGPTVVIRDGDEWLDFFDACPSRSPFGH